VHERPELSLEEYYARAPEEARLQSGHYVLERARTQELLQRFMPTPPATVLDIGGGAGAYAFWLADLGHAVHLVDLTPRLVTEARRLNANRQPSLQSCEVGDARSLAFGDASADAVLLLGPLYHLVEREERLQALHEAHRVLKPSGLLFGAAISRWASLFVAMSRGWFGDEAFATIVDRDIRDGQHRNPTDRIACFTTAFFHRPDELRNEVESAGFSLEGIFGLEGPGGLMPDVDERVADPQRCADLLHVARLLESEPSVIGVSDHLLAVARKAT
jgi:ubiquinone/menaquinone biosynthesis C-methylase UbiE